jgi:hypothetical protein
MASLSLRHAADCTVIALCEEIAVATDIEEAYAFDNTSERTWQRKLCLHPALFWNSGQGEEYRIRYSDHVFTPRLNTVRLGLRGCRQAEDLIEE